MAVAVEVIHLSYMVMEEVAEVVVVDKEMQQQVLLDIMESLEQVAVAVAVLL